MPRPAKRKGKVANKNNKVEETKAAKKTKVVKKVKKENPKAKANYLWIYGEPKIEDEAYEFHPKLQDYIEECFQKGKKCHVCIFATVWILDFNKMVKIEVYNGKPMKRGFPIKRVTKTAAKSMRSLVGIQGYRYERKCDFVQTENICSVCLCVPVMKTKIDLCGHFFCFMCLKSNYNVGLECPTCRGRIPIQLVMESTVRLDMDLHQECSEEYTKECQAILDNPDPDSDIDSDEEEEVQKPASTARRSNRLSTTKYYWIYQAKRNGWYRYDPRTEYYIEECYKRKKNRCQAFISGYNFTINMKDKYQERVMDGGRHRRKIMRIKSTDVLKHNVRGMAGMDMVVYPVERV